MNPSDNSVDVIPAGVIEVTSGCIWHKICSSMKGRVGREWEEGNERFIRSDSSLTLTASDTGVSADSVDGSGGRSTPLSSSPTLLGERDLDWRDDG
jgi:hypothetical protein